MNPSSLQSKKLKNNNVILFATSKAFFPVHCVDVMQSELQLKLVP